MLTPLLTAAVLVLGGCSGLPDLTEEQAAACADLVDALPDTLAGEALTDSDERSASWGDLELTCGVERPEEYDEYAPCTEVGGVGWFVPDAELEDLGGDATATALTTIPFVALHVPAGHREGVDAALTELAGPLTEHLGAGRPCH